MDNYCPEDPPEQEFQKASLDPSINVKISPQRALIMETILEAIGHTPMVRLNKIPQSMGIEAEIRKFGLCVRSF